MKNKKSLIIGFVGGIIIIVINPLTIDCVVLSVSCGNNFIYTKIKQHDRNTIDKNR